MIFGVQKVYIQYLEMEKKKDYELMHKLGEGSYGSVYRAKWVKNDRIVAIKRTKTTHEDEGIPSTTLREISILKNISHPNLVELYDVSISKANHDSLMIDLVFEYMNEDLSKFIRKNHPLPIDQTKNFFYQALCGGAALHRSRIIHRDLKPQNILIDGKTVKIADFGLSRKYPTIKATMSKEIATLWYRAPEVILGQQKYDETVDVWALGCVLYEMFEGKVLFLAQSQIGQIMSIFDILGTPHINDWPGVKYLPHFKKSFPKLKQNIKSRIKRLPPEGVDLLLEMLNLNPTKRISLSEALKHPFFNGIGSQNQMVNE